MKSALLPRRKPPQYFSADESKLTTKTSARKAKFSIPGYGFRVNSEQRRHFARCKELWALDVLPRRVHRAPPVQALPEEETSPARDSCGVHQSGERKRSLRT